MSNYKANFKCGQCGFTLIEVIVAIGVLGVALPSIIAIIFTLMVQQAKVERLGMIKEEGDYLVSMFNVLIGDSAVSIESNKIGTKICNTAGSLVSSGDIWFVDRYGNRFRIRVDSNNKIASDSSIANAGGVLTSNRSLITDFKIQCQRRNNYSNPTVQVSFQIGYRNDSDRVSEAVGKLTYRTFITMRRYRD